jgi:hypothetical protein
VRNRDADRRCRLGAVLGQLGEVLIDPPEQFEVSNGPPGAMRIMKKDSVTMMNTVGIALSSRRRV